MEDVVRQRSHKLVLQLNFPPGYHFVPTETELLDIYLRRKIEGQALPLGVVNEVAILDWQPGSLVEAYKGYGESKWYFFTVREPSSSNKEKEPDRKVRVPGVKATWKATGSVVPFPAADDDDEELIVGTKRVLIYQSSDPEEDGMWSMHEYILKGHAKIGQYALCSIQRKQHSDIVDDDNAGEGSSRRKGRKRTNATNMDPGKAKKRRTKKSSIQLEGVQLQHQETGSIEAQVKPKSRARRTATKRKNKGSTQDDEGQQQQKQQQHQEEEVALAIPIKPPLTPPKEAPPEPLQQEQMAFAAHSKPVHGYPHQDGILGASTPMHEEGGTIIASSFQYHDMSSFLETLVMLDDQEEQPPSFTASEFIADHDHAQYQLNQQQDGYCNNLLGIENQHLYIEQQSFSDNTAQNNNSWNHGQHQIYQQEIGYAFGAQDQQTDAQHYYDQLPYYEQIEYSPMLAQIGYCSSDQFTGSVQGDTATSGSNGHTDLDDAESSAMTMLCDCDPQDCVGAQDGSNPEALQSQDEPQWSCAQQ
ncbi:unnamed protein product [Urochloa decumbens]|uniref:NAC domain-containing protein n=1 Tax=Urochloa decumbens TaxID=240449 RepID=A0ABC8WK78_9POAL